MVEHSEIEAHARAYIEAESDDAFRYEVEQLLSKGSQEELADRFYTTLEFGTGGLRGVIGGGYNRMNSFVVRRATLGLARYVNRNVRRTRGEQAQAKAVIAYDNRRYSSEFALQAALVLCANGIETYLFSGLRPTPELSFAIRMLDADTGIVVTASHNPPEYNGYKVYWNDGSQVVAPHDKGIIEEVSRVTGSVSAIDRQEAIERGLLHMIDEEVDERFLDMVERQIVRRGLFRESGDQMHMVYTPLHGTGAMLIECICDRLGLKLSVVPEQRDPDSEFPTVESPNPEEGSALHMAIELAKEKGADLVVGSDPDADRIGIAVRNAQTGDYELLTGNQHGVLLVDYVLGSRSELGTLPAKPAFIKTIVTTELQRLVAEAHGAEVFDTLTGFKHIAARIREFENTPGAPQYVLGDEESYGYMIGTEVRDKDAISATVLTAEMALYYRTQGKTLLDRLEEVYRRFGYFEERTISGYFRGRDGAKVMADLMTSLRDNTPERFAGLGVVRVHDYERRVTIDPRTGTQLDEIDLPVSNVLQFVLEDATILSVRPSGTEPKIKFYVSVRVDPSIALDVARREASERLSEIEQEIDRLIPGGR